MLHPDTFKVNDKNIKFTHLDKVLWPKDGFSKYDLIRYYLEISSYILPYLHNRFLVFQRFPEGINRPGFYQKNCPQGAPPWIKRVPFLHGSKFTEYVVADGPETLAWLGNQSCVEIHPWLSQAHAPDTPDFAVFDLDPMEGVSREQLCEAVLSLKEVLQELGVRGYPKTSGSRGIQVYVPLEPVYTYEDTRVFVEKTFRMVWCKLSSFTTMEREKAKRGKKIYLDYLQNGRGKTLVAPYSPRPQPGAAVSTPLSWDEIETVSFSLSQTIKSMPFRLQDRGDLFLPLLQDRQKLPGNLTTG